MAMKNPLKAIEDRTAWVDFGRQGMFVYQGALEEGADSSTAFKIVAAFFAGMFEGAARANDDKEDKDA